MIFFVWQKNHPKRKGCVKMKIIKEKIEFEKSLKQWLEFICEFSNVTPTFINGSIRKIDKTNLSYIEPHRVIVKGITFLFFNYSNDIYISNLTNKIKISELEEYLKVNWKSKFHFSIKILKITQTSSFGRFYMFKKLYFL